MSLLNKTPYLNSVLSNLDSEELAELSTLIDGSSSFVYRSLVDGNHLLSEDDKMKAMNLQVANNKPLISGWFLGEAFIQYFPNRPELQMWAINLNKMIAKPVDEPFTATDLRSLLNGGSGGGGTGSAPIFDAEITEESEKITVIMDSEDRENIYSHKYSVIGIHVIDEEENDVVLYFKIRIQSDEADAIVYDNWDGSDGIISQMELTFMWDGDDVKVIFETNELSGGGSLTYATNSEVDELFAAGE